MGTLKEEKYLQELESPSCDHELKIILSKVIDGQQSGDLLFKDKYLVFILENFLFWQKPLKEQFHKTIAICRAKPLKYSDPGTDGDSKLESSEVFSEDSGSPLPYEPDESMLRSYISSPLVEKLSLSYHLSALSGNVARKILSLCNSAMDEVVTKLPVVIISHGENPKSHVFLASSQDRSLRLVVTNLGAISKQEQLLRISNLKESHLEGFSPSLSSVETSIFARYDFIASECEQESPSKPFRHAKLALECQWGTSTFVLEPVAEDCTCFAKINAIAGNHNSGASVLYKDLKRIQVMKEGICSHFMVWPSKPDLDVMKNVKDFINEAKFSLSKESSPGFFDLDYFEDAVLEERKNLDFTEKLWCLLKDCSSLKELTEAFHFVYQALEEFVVPPFVHKDSGSRLALAIKNMRDKPIFVPPSDSCLAVELLIEIGIEKVRRDYTSLFVGFELIPSEYIKFFIESPLLDQKAIDSLCLLHSILELALVCIKQLLLSKELLRQFLRSTFMYYTTVSNTDEDHVFSFQIPSIKARQLLNVMRPTIWEISFLSHDGSFLKQSIHRFQTKASPDHVYAPQNSHPKLLLNTTKYTYLKAILLQDNYLHDDVILSSQDIKVQDSNHDTTFLNSSPDSFAEYERKPEEFARIMNLLLI